MKTEKIVLYADDDSDDKLWVSDACRNINCGINFNFVENGKEVIEFLQQKSDKYPSLIVLDLNMPELDGKQTLRKLKSDPNYKDIPVAIVTTSANKTDKEVCQHLGAALYLVKPDTHKDWQKIVKQLAMCIL